MNFEDCYEGQAVYQEGCYYRLWIEEIHEDEDPPTVLVRSTLDDSVRKVPSKELTPIPVRADYDEKELWDKIRELYKEFNRRLNLEVGWDVDRDSLAQIRIYGPGEQDLRHFRISSVMRPEECSLEEYEREIRRLQGMQSRIDQNLEWTIESMLERAKTKEEEDDYF